MLDLTVASIPIYFGTMAAEHRHLRAQAAEHGPGPADYTPQDTATSLAMGLGSLVVPLVLPKVVRHVVPGKGRYGKALVGVAAAAAVATTVADRLADRAEDEPSPATKRQRLGRLARRARRVTGPVAVGAGALAVTTSFAARPNAEAQWAAGGADRDKGSGPLPWFVAKGDVEAGRLKRVLPNQRLKSAVVYWVQTPDKPTPEKVLALRDFLVERAPRMLVPPSGT